MNNAMNSICLYHSSDLDGHCSGAIYAKAHKGRQFTLWPIDYGDEFPWDQVQDADVTIIDWSLQPFNDFRRLMQVAKSVTWIDHHKSAIAEWTNAGQPVVLCAVLDVKRAGCELAWDHFFPGDTMPDAVRLLGRYDVWDHEADDLVLPFQYGMRLLDTDPRDGRDRQAWRELLQGEGVKNIVTNGRLLLRYQTQNDAAAVAKAWFPVEFAGKQWQACNRLGKGSKFFDSVRDAAAFHGMMSFGWDGRQWVVGLYSDRDTMDCGAIAKEHGGGGHPGAAGFLTHTLPFPLQGGSDEP